MATWANPPSGDSFPSGTWLSAPTSPVSDSACTARSAGIWWNALGTTSLRQGLNAASTIGVGPVDGWSVSFFGGVGGYGIGHYLPLDGTVFKDSRSVDTEPFVGTGSLGFAVRHGGFVLSLAASFSTDAFETQEEVRRVRHVEPVLVFLTFGAVSDRSGLRRNSVQAVR